MPGVQCAVGTASGFPFPRKGCPCPAHVPQLHTTPYLHSTLVDWMEEERLAVRAEVNILLEEIVSDVQQLLFLGRIGLI